MRVCVDGRYLRDDHPGVSRYLFNLLRGLTEVAGAPELVVLADARADGPRHPLEELRRRGLRLWPSPSRPRTARDELALPALLRRLRADVFHAPFYATPGLCPCPRVVTVFDTLPLDPGGCLAHGARRLLAGWALRRACRSSARILTLSEHARADLQRRLGVAPERVSVTPGAPDPRFAPASPEAVAALVRRLGLPPRYVLGLGAHRPHKNLPRLVEAWAALDGAERAGHALVLAGREDHRYPDVRRRVAELGLGCDVRFAGEVAEADLPALLSGATCLALPSLGEGFGLPALEAMACGTPVVCSSASSLPEVTGGAALLVDPVDTASIAAALRLLIADPERRAALARSGLTRAARFDWRRTARLTVEAYGQALAAGG